MLIPYTEATNQLPKDTSNRLKTLVNKYIGISFPALQLAVYHQGKPAIDAAWGWIDPDSQQHPTTPKSRFDLASLTKLFVSTAFLSLINDSRVSLDEPIVSIIPEFGTHNPRPIDGGQDPHTKAHLLTPVALQEKTVDPTIITFRHLMTHTSGLSPWRDVYQSAGPAPTPPNIPDPIPRDSRWKNALQALCNYAFVDLPGNQIRYSDLGLMLLGEATSRLHDTPGHLEEAVQTQVLSKLELETTLFNPLQSGLHQERTVPTEIDPTWRKRRCWGEVHDENACGVGGVAGHAGLFSTAHDVATFGQAWLTNDPRFSIPPDMMDAAKQEQVIMDIERRGLGWMLKSRENSSAGDSFHELSFGHTGFTGTCLWIDPERQLVIACLTNAVYLGREHMNVHPFRRAINTFFAEELGHT